MEIPVTGAKWRPVTRTSPSLRLRTGQMNWLTSLPVFPPPPYSSAIVFAGCGAVVVGEIGPDTIPMAAITATIGMITGTGR